MSQLRLAQLNKQTSDKTKQGGIGHCEKRQRCQQGWNRTSRTGYPVCRAHCKTKNAELLVQTYWECQDSDNKAFNQMWGPVYLQGSYGHKAPWWMSEVRRGGDPARGPVKERLGTRGLSSQDFSQWNHLQCDLLLKISQVLREVADFLMWMDFL